MLYKRLFKETNWKRILLFYGIIMLGTYFARQCPNLIKMLLATITEVPFSFNYNHGMVTLLASLIFYRLARVQQSITLLGTERVKSFLFPVILFASYTIFGINNSYGFNNHLWAFIICLFAFGYNILEEYAWRGFLLDNLKSMPFILKSVISGILWATWHLLVFSDFKQYGGFWIFLVLCIVFSFLLTFAAWRTKSIMVAAAVHTCIIQTHIVALICGLLFLILLIAWNKIKWPLANAGPDKIAF